MAFTCKCRRKSRGSDLNPASTGRWHQYWLQCLFCSKYKKLFWLREVSHIRKDRERLLKLSEHVPNKTQTASKHAYKMEDNFFLKIMDLNFVLPMQGLFISKVAMEGWSLWPARSLCMLYFRSCFRNHSSQSVFLLVSFPSEIEASLLVTCTARGRLEVTCKKRWKQRSNERLFSSASILLTYVVFAVSLFRLWSHNARNSTRSNS